MNPRISVIMAAYNAEKYIGMAIDSILKQSYRNFEFIIIDDCSADKTLEIIKKYRDKRIRVASNKRNLGLTKNLNKGLRMARGEYIARMDADDISLPERFSEQVMFLDKHPDTGLVGTWADIIDSTGARIGEIAYAADDHSIRQKFVQRSQFIHPSVMFRKSILKRSGHYDESFRSAQDYEFFPRVLMHCKGANIPKTLLQYRWDFSQNEGFTTGKRQERNALRARWRMITRYGWPKWHAIYIVKPSLSYLVPMVVKRSILKRIARRKN